MPHQAIIPVFGAFETWRAKARAFALQGVQPADVSWSRLGDAPGLFDAAPDVTGLLHGTLKVPKAFLDLAEDAVCFADTKGFALLYRILVRLQTETALLANPADADVSALQKICKEVHRDCHKMRAFVRFKEIPGESSRRHFAAWFEPDNFIIEHNAPFFARRFADMDWVIATPKGTVKFESGALSFAMDESRPPRLTDDMDTLWQAYYANIFNPARLKVKSMQSHMPKKYWKNLPEAELIPDLIAGAAVKAQEMRDKAPTLVPKHLHKIKAPTVMVPAITETFESLDALKEAACHCQRCTLSAHATQTVFGEGAAQSPLMFVGEQPGDQEDLAGRPFVGPAGKIFDEAMAAAGIDRWKAYVTNAVKHFKFSTKGKRRLHERPNGMEILACASWLMHEISFVNPETIVAMGATALESLTGNGKGIMKRRGTFERDAKGRRIFITYHPSAILRAPDPAVSARMKAEFFSDIAQLKALG